MKASVILEIRPFEVPRTAFAQGFPMPPSPSGAPQVPPQAPWDPVAGLHIPLSELDPRTLDVLCEHFRAEVFRLAGKDQPPEATPSFLSGTLPFEEIAKIERARGLIQSTMEEFLAEGDVIYPAIKEAVDALQSVLDAGH